MNRLLQILFGTKAERKPARQKKTQLGLEPLEDRCLMTTASLHFLPGHIGVLAVQGSAGNDAITVAHVGSRISVSGVPGSFKASDVQKLVVNGGAGNDTIRVNLLPADHIGVVVHGGAGNDTLFGSVLRDKLFGDAGSDHIYGRQGDDSIDGGPGQDYLYGGDGNDFLQADFDDFVVHGEKGTDTIAYAHQDPSRLSFIHGDETKLANFINNSGLLDNLPLSWTKNHVKYRINHLQLVDVSISNHVSRLVLRGELHTETTAKNPVNGHPLASAKGTIRFSVQPVLKMVLGEEDLVNSASVTLGNTAVEAINIHNINNAVDNPGQFRIWLNNALAVVPDMIVPLDMTTVAKQFPPHSGPTNLYINFDGASNVAAFVSTTGDRDRDIQEILYRVSEEFAPFNVQVRRIVGAGNYSKVNGNTTIFVGDNSDITNSGGRTPSKHMDAPIAWRAENHQPNSDPWNYAYVDPIYNADTSQNYNNNDIAKVAAHEAGHTFGLLHSRTMGHDPDLLDDTDTDRNPPDVMAYDSDSRYEYFRNSTYNITIRNRDSDGVGTHPEEGMKATWYGETISRQNSYTYLQAVLGARPADDVANVFHRDYTHGRALVDSSYVDSPLKSVVPGSPLYGAASPGDYDVYQLGTVTGTNDTLSITVRPTTLTPYIDPVVQIYDDLDGELVAYNNDQSPGNRSSQVNFQPKVYHTYKVVVGVFNGASSGYYRVSVANVVSSPLSLGSLSGTTTTTTTTSS